MSALPESEIETHCIKLLHEQGYENLSPKQQEEERENSSEVVLRNRLRNAINKLNPNIPPEAREYALRELLNFAEQDLTANNQKFHRFFADGMNVEYRKNGNIVGDIVQFADFESPENNDFAVCSQFSVRNEQHNRRPDVVLFINGLPVVVMELKNPTDERATLETAYNQLQTYKADIPALFQYNGILVVSDGMDTKIGSLTAKLTRFSAWKEDKEPARIETLIANLFCPARLLSYLRHFIVFEKQHDGDIDKKIAACHQYRAVNEAVAKTHTASQTGGNGKIGIVWHAQGSGKSLSMVFYAGKMVLELGNPTIVVVTDRNDLDEQLFDTFAENRPLLRQEPTQANSRAHLQELLKTAGGGIVFTTLQKFLPEQTGEKFPTLSTRRNIVVIADEAHRSHYGFSAKINADGRDAPHISYGFAKHLRDALPNASFIGFTATPIEKEDASTRAVFGDEIDIYDMQESVSDGATVPIYYESRLVKMDMDGNVREKIDNQVEALIGDPEDQAAAEQAKQKWATLEAIVGNTKRLQAMAEDIVNHFEGRGEAGNGKAMIVTMSRRIAVELYKHITKIRPQWHDDDKDKGAIKVVMTANATDPLDWQPHHTTKEERKSLGSRLKKPDDSLKLAIVVDMWLTGFDAPCLHTMYIDKPMRGHNLMQAIARVNRIYKDKAGGFIVDYIGVAMNLQQAVNAYTNSGGEGKPVFEQKDAIDKMREEHEIVAQMFSAFDYKQFFSTDTGAKMTILLDAQEHVLQLKDGKERFYQHVSALSQAFALSLPSEAALQIREEIAFFVAVKSRLTKFEPTQNARSNTETEIAIRQIVDKALVAGKVVDIFDAAGLNKPKLSILSDEFLEQIRNMERKNHAIALLKKLLSGEFQARERKNLIRTRKLSDMLDEILKRYRNNLLTAAQIIDELISLAKEIRESDNRGKATGLSEDEVAFYDALANNESARNLMGDKQLFALAQALVEKVRASATLDWTIRDSVRAKMRVIIRGILKKYGYPPDMEKLATDDILKQAEQLAGEWAAKQSDETKP